MRKTFPCLEPEPVGGNKLSNVEDIYAERRRLERWWTRIEANLFPEVVGDEIGDYQEAVAESRRRVLELIAAGEVDPNEAARAALVEQLPKGPGHVFRVLLPEGTAA